MEFFEIAEVCTSAEGIRKIVTIETLPEWCDEVESVDIEEELGRVIYFLQWGRYHIKCAEVMGGVRFWVPDCPNALAWTITTGYPPHPDMIVLHATFNRLTHSEEFISATKSLLKACKNGLEGFPETKWPAPSAPSVPFGDLRSVAR